MVQYLAILSAIVLDVSGSGAQTAMPAPRIVASIPASGDRHSARSTTATIKERRWNARRDFGAAEMSIDFACVRPVRSLGSTFGERRLAAHALLRTGVTLAVTGDDAIELSVTARGRKQSGSDEQALRLNSVRSLSADIGWHRAGVAASVGLFTDAAKRAVPRHDRMAELARDPALLASGVRLTGLIEPAGRDLSLGIDARLQRVAVADAAIRAGGRTDARAGVTGRLRF